MGTETKQAKLVSLHHAAKFAGQVLSDEPGWKATKGECATGVQYVFAQAGVPLGRTAGWRRGQLVKGNDVAPGTAIASFRQETYANDHAAILVKQTSDGLEVYDQFNHPPKAWGKRTLSFQRPANDYSNNGGLFYVILS